MHRTSHTPGNRQLASRPVLVTKRSRVLTIAKDNMDGAQANALLARGQARLADRVEYLVCKLAMSLAVCG